MQSVVRDASLGLLATGISIFLKFVESGIVEPSALNTEPYYIFSVQFELMLTAVGLLFVFTPDLTDASRQLSVRGIWVGILVAFLLIYVSIVISARTWAWARDNEAFFAVVLPDAIGIFVLIFVLGVVSKDVRNV